VTIKDCYDKVGINYEEILDWFPNEAAFLRALVEFCRTPDFCMMRRLLMAGKEGEAFYYADNFKDQCYNLGFRRMGDISKHLVGVMKVEHAHVLDDPDVQALYGELHDRYEYFLEQMRQVDCIEGLEIPQAQL